MKDTAILVKNLGKEYRIGGIQKSYDTLGAQITDIFTSPFRRAGKLLRGQAAGVAELDERFWALRDISFTVERGEAVGIIGRNGAGKSTLLKILSRITGPTTGEAIIKGRVGSLLEVGTGFHPELTGRENVFLNGAILGMQKSEIERKFDEIVAFAEIDKFIDTPVKHYSSGMYVRLAFSVAAHLEPEVLLVDEVLAVGDVAFQKKCLGKMDDVAQAGRTVLFVSHNMGLIQLFCTRGIFLQEGRIHTDGPIEAAIDAYLQTLEQAKTQDLSVRTDRKGYGRARLIGVDYCNSDRDCSPVLKAGGAARFTFEVDRVLPGMDCNFFLYDHIGQPVVSFKSEIRGAEDVYDAGIGARFVCDVDELLLLPGRYRMDVVIIGDGVTQDFIEAATVFDVGTGQIGRRPAQPDGKFAAAIPSRWRLPVQ